MVTKTVSENGFQKWRNEIGQFHREDGPAIIWPGGIQEWFLNGKRHREDGPAVTNPYGYQVWYLNGKRHREDGPAVIYSNGDQEWYRNGIKVKPKGSDAVTKTVDFNGAQRWYNEKGGFHREDGPAVIWVDGSQFWFQNGNLHREDGPAVTRPDGNQSWYLNGKRHREDGPAVIYSNGKQEWYRNGIKVEPPTNNLKSNTPDAVLKMELALPLKLAINNEPNLDIHPNNITGGVEMPVRTPVLVTIVDITDPLPLNVCVDGAAYVSIRAPWNTVRPRES